MHQLPPLRDCPSQGHHSLWGWPKPCAPHGLQGHPKSTSGVLLAQCPLLSHGWDCSEPHRAPGMAPRCVPRLGTIPSVLASLQEQWGAGSHNRDWAQGRVWGSH